MCEKCLDRIDWNRPPTTDELKGRETRLFRFKRWLFMKVFLSWRWWRTVNREYPQTWFCVPGFRPIRWLVQRVCGWLGGHELSDTEFSWDGYTVMRNCRWCDRAFFLPPDDCGDPERVLLLSSFAREFEREFRESDPDELI